MIADVAFVKTLWKLQSNFTFVDSGKHITVNHNCSYDMQLCMSCSSGNIICATMQRL